MSREDLERFAFLYFCRKEDRDLIMGKEKMKFADFERLIYICDFLGLQELSMAIWLQYEEQFKETYKRLGQLMEEKGHDEGFGLSVDDIEFQQTWIVDFYKKSSMEKKNELRKVIENICNRENWKLYGWAGVR